MNWLHGSGWLGSSILIRSGRQAYDIKNDQPSGERLGKLAEARPRFGYRRLEVLLRREGRVVNHKRVYRVYQALDLTFRKKTRRKRAMQRRTPLTVSTAANQR